MIITHQFDTDIDGDTYLEKAHRLGPTFSANLYDIDNFCRSKIKYDETVSDEVKAVLQQIREMIDGRVFEE